MTMGKSESLKINTLVLGEGFPSRLWHAFLEEKGIDFLGMGTAVDPSAFPSEAGVIIETEETQYYESLRGLHAHDDHDDEEDDEEHAGHDHGNGHASSPLMMLMTDVTLAEGGVLFAPCYSISPTSMAHAYGEWADSVIGYTLFPRPGEGRGAPMIEVARPLQTTDAAWNRGLEFLTGAGFRPEVVGDSPGLIFGRTVACLINEASIALGEGIATIKDMDTGVQLGLNYPKGLFAWADELGLSLIVDILEGLYDHYQEDRYRPAPLLRQLLLAGKTFGELSAAGR